MIFKKICEILCQIGIEEPVKLEYSLKKDLGMDSSELAYFIVDVKKIFGRDLDEKIISNMTISDIVELLDK